MVPEESRKLCTKCFVLGYSGQCAQCAEDEEIRNDRGFGSQASVENGGSRRE